MIEIARWSVSTTSTISASALLKSFASFALTAFAAVNSESDDVLGYLVLDVRGLGCSFSLGDVSHRTHVFGLVAALWFASPAVGFALLACCCFALLGSFHHFSRSSMFFSRSSYCFLLFFSPLALWLWFRLCCSPESL